MFGPWLKLLPASNRPTARTLRALSCPPRSLVSSGQFPSCRLPRTRSGIRQDALSVIAIGPHMIDARADQPRAVRREKPAESSLMNCNLSALRMQTEGQSPRLGTLNKQWSFPTRNRTFDAKCGVFSLLVAEQRRDRRDVSYRICWKRLARCEVLLKARRTCVVGGKEARRSEAIVHLLEVSGARQDVVARIKRVETETIANAELDPGARHELHQAHCAARRRRMLVSCTLNLHHSTDPARRDAEAIGCFVDEFSEPIDRFRTPRSLCARARFKERRASDLAHERRDGYDDARDCPERKEPCNRVRCCMCTALPLQAGRMFIDFWTWPVRKDRRRFGEAALR